MAKRQIRISQNDIRSLIREAIGRSLDDNENLWQGDDELEEPDEEINERRQIRLSEGQLREFVSYSVARLLKEAVGRDIYLSNGEYDGYEEDEYGTDSFVFEPDIDKYLDDSIDFPEYPKVKVYYTKSEGMKGDGYMQPDDPDTYDLDFWEIVNQNGMPQEVIKATEQYMENDFDLEEEAANHEMMNESRLGEWSPAGFEDDVFDSQERMMKKSEEPGRNGMKVGGFGLNKGIPSKYKDENGDWLSWEDYCKMKEAERGGDDDLSDVLRGGKGGSVGGFKK